MKKKAIGLAVFAAALTLTSGITAFAGTWEADSWGKYYVQDDGSRIYAQQWTDPDTGYTYFFDPDGYAMINADLGSAGRTDDDGRIIELTEEEIARKAARAAELANRPNPAKQTAAAAESAKTSTASTSTHRSPFQAEMEVFMEKIFTATRGLRTDAANTVDGNEDNTEKIYGFKNSDGYRFISATLWKSGRETAANYKPQAFELSYHFDAVGTDANIYEQAYKDLAIAALGDTEGAAVIDYVQSERENGSTTFDRTGTTDSGNAYTLTYRNNLLTIAVTCSEIDPPAEETAEGTEGEAADTAEEADTTVTSTTSVIVAGQGQAAQDAEEEDTEDTAEEETEEAVETVDETTEETAAEDSSTEA